ncbi:hypothetical protein F0562_006029 [Nyssa sinensis]|uniref:Uncharacterized protein n=1 Tax=Nyssa sinensis TaxID=561372 RepID=A0A5J5AKW3_9ASTE|nr:hypothetical protein F0562_006029 [Nyssa sinensis]
MLRFCGGSELRVGVTAGIHSFLLFTNFTACTTCKSSWATRRPTTYAGRPVLEYWEQVVIKENTGHCLVLGEVCQLRKETNKGTDRRKQRHRCYGELRVGQPQTQQANGFGYSRIINMELQVIGVDDVPDWGNDYLAVVLPEQGNLAVHGQQQQ